MEFQFIGDSGQTTIFGCVKRDSDDTFYRPSTGLFVTGLSAAARAITLPEGSGTPGNYYTDIDTSAWSDGTYEFLVQDSGNGNQTLAGNQFSISAGTVSSPGANAYYADIDVNIDRTSSLDEYTITWFKNGVPVESGITSPLLHVMNRAGTALLNNVAMTSVANGVYKYDSAQTLSRGESYVVTTRATIDGSQRTGRKVVGRDS